MDWDAPIKRNQPAMVALLLSLLAVVAHAEGGRCKVVPRHVRSAVFLLLRPLESATRRLIVIAARGVEVALPPKGAPSSRGKARSAKARKRSGLFALLDTLKRYQIAGMARRSGAGPRASIPGVTPDPVFRPEHQPTSPDDLVSAENLITRLDALSGALADLPAQARRLARWEALRDRRMAEGRRRGRFSVRRPGRPPGLRARAIHPVDHWLKDLDALVLYSQNLPET